MEGISIGRDRASAEIRDHGIATDFEDFFRPLYPMLADYSWLVDGALFAFPDDQSEPFTQDVLASDGDCRYFRPGSLERWARFLVDDWCDLVGFRAAAGDPHTLVTSNRGRLLDDNILAMSPPPDCVFHCVDAARWTFYARDEALLNIARDHIASQTGLRVWKLDLGDDVT
jgi:hypothetical protein